MEHQFREEFLRYNKTLRQRNEALKAKDKNQAKWMEELAFLGEKITTMRENYLTALTPHFANSKEFIMPDHDLLFEYDRGWEKGKSLLAALQDKEDIDFDRGYTSRGPQNADLRILLNNQEAYKICSRGQQKLIANIMLLSQSKGFFEVKKFPSIILVDDLSAELTLEMQEKILERLFETNSQIFLTALNDSVLAEILNEMEAGVFHVEHGEIAQ